MLCLCKKPLLLEGTGHRRGASRLGLESPDLLKISGPETNFEVSSIILKDMRIGAKVIYSLAQFQFFFFFFHLCNGHNSI